MSSSRLFSKGGRWVVPRLVNPILSQTRSMAAFTSTVPKVSASAPSQEIAHPYADSLNKVAATQVTRLSNGFTIATEANPHVRTATVGVWINAGSRSETKETNGVAHFLEHMAFKGTKSRTQTQLETQIENMGGHLNAYTSREQTVYYAKALDSDVNTATEILSDILQGASLNNDAIERERGTILREAEEVEKNKEEVVFDHLHATAFQQSSLGYTILGPQQNIESITRKNLEDYIKANYTPERMVLSAAGAVDHAALVKKAEALFGSLARGQGVKAQKKPHFFGSDVRARYDSHPTCHVAFAVEGASWTSPDYWPLLVAQSIIGTWDRGMGAAGLSGSRLAQVVHENGLANNFMAFNTSYSDTGMFGVYAVTENADNLINLTHVIQQEWHRLAMNVSAGELLRAKNALKTSMLLALDGTTATAEDIGRQMLVYGRRLAPWEVDGLIESVTAEDVMRVAGQYIYDQEVAVVGYGPIENLPDYNRIRSAMSPIYY